MRESPASSAASVNVSQVSVIFSIGVSKFSKREVPISKVTAPPKSSLPVNRFRISAPAALKEL